MSKEILKLNGVYDIPTEKRLIAEWKEIHPKGTSSHRFYLNNFSLLLPQPDGSRRFDAYRDTRPWLDEDRCSPLLRTQSFGEFFDNIDGALKDSDIYDKTLTLRNSHTQMDDLYELVLPAYFKLREKGYWRYLDLIG